MGKRLDKIYIKALRNQQEGHAVFVKLLANEVKPGTCGYIDARGDWNTVLQLTEKEQIEKLELPALDVQAKDDHGTTYWTPKTSARMSEQAITLEGKLVPPGCPAGANAGYEYKNEASSGAVLMTYGPIITSRITNVLAMRHWMNKHIEAVVQASDFETIKERGLWVITKIYSAQKRRIAVMASKGKRVAFHMGAKAKSAVEVRGSAEWWNSEQSTSGWITDKSNKGEKGILLFFAGIWWKPEGFFSKSYRMVEEEKKQSVLDGGDEDVFMENVDPKTEEEREEPVLKLVPGIVGDVESRNGEDFEGLPVHSDYPELYEVDEDEDENDDSEDGGEQ